MRPLAYGPGDPASPSLARRYEIGRADRTVAVVLFVGLVLLFLWPFVVVVIRPGEVGVLYRLFTDGTVTAFTYGEGITVKWPWNRVYRYDMRTQSRDEIVHGLASDGLSVKVAATVLYRPNPGTVGLLHKHIGPDYAERIVRPTTIEAIRTVIGRNGPHDLYRLGTNALESEILRHFHGPQHKYIDFESVIIRDIVLPQQVHDAVARKLTEEQNAQAYDYIIAQAKKEAERKRIEAIGTQTFYSIVAKGLSSQVLTWRGIEATVQIGRSPNAKVVILGGGKDQLPLILGSDIAAQPLLPAPPLPVDPRADPLPDLDALPPLVPGAVSFPARPPTGDAALPTSVAAPGEAARATPSRAIGRPP